MVENNKARRDFLKYIGALGIMTFYSVPLHAKTTKAVVNYQPMPNDDNKCDMCMHFLPETNECKIIEGKIDPNGWCKFFYKNPNSKPT